jgi:hypothetical protein
VLPRTPKPGVTDLTPAELDAAATAARREIQGGSTFDQALLELERIYPSVTPADLIGAVTRAQETIDVYAEFLAGDRQQLPPTYSPQREGQVAPWEYSVWVYVEGETAGTMERCLDVIQSDHELTPDELIQLVFDRLTQAEGKLCKSPVIVSKSAAMGGAAIELLSVYRGG